MQGAVYMSLSQFSIIYILLLVVIAIMKKYKINQSKLLLIASIRMTIQLIIAGLILTLIFDHPHKLFVILYILAMVLFATHRVLSRNPNINKHFKAVVVLSIAGCGVAVMIFFVHVVAGKSIFIPQYTIPISGMIFGNMMTGLNLGLKTFNESISIQRNRIESLLNIGAKPDDILLPFANNALETALLPTMNSMLGMGIVSLPGMMTGQILAGTMPMTAILYQISITISMCTAVCLSVFVSLHFGYKTMYNKLNQIIISA